MQSPIDKAKKLVHAGTLPIHDKTWRIRVNGEFIKTRSGKTSWAKRAHAINALKNSVSYSEYNWGKKIFPDLDWRESQELVPELWDELIKEGYIEFVEVG